MKKTTQIKTGTAKDSTARRLASGCFFLFLCTISGCDSDKNSLPVAATKPQQKTVQPPTNNQTLQSATLPSHQQRQTPKLNNDQSTSPWFDDITSVSNLNFTYSDGSAAGLYQLLESVGGGVLVTDYDNDGWLDVVLPGGGTLLANSPAAEALNVVGRSAGLFRNDTDCKFGERTEVSGMKDDSLYSHGGTASDLNADGFDDLVVCGFGNIQVWLNAGDGTFTRNEHLINFPQDEWAVSCVATDYDLDGISDLYVLTYADWAPSTNQLCVNDQQLRDICGPTLFKGAQDRLYHGDGEHFSDVTEKMKLSTGNRGLGIVATDFDGDARPDLAVVNDVQENQLYLNRQNQDFSEEAVIWGMAYSDTGEREGSMGVAAADYDQDGFLDMWYTNYAQQDNSLLRNSSNSGFLQATSSAGLRGASRNWVGFGTGFADFDCDGWDDLFVINGHVAYERLDSPYFQPPQLFRNHDGQSFHDVSNDAGSYFLSRRSGRGAATVDFDNNGTMDLIVSHQNDPVCVLRNNHKCNHWISFDIIGVTAQRSAIGAVVSIKMQAGKQLKKWRVSGGSYLSQSDQRLMFTLPTDQPVDVKVILPGGNQEAFNMLPTGTVHKLIQGRGKDVSS